MRPAPFAYEAPTSLEEALERLDGFDDISVLAGGQSLVPMFNMRVSRPDVVLDITRIPTLRGIRETPDGGLEIGATTTQREIERSSLVADRAPILQAVLPHVAHLAIRERGTIGGSLAHADPSAELPAAVTVLDGRVRLRSASDTRTLTPGEFFVGALMTALEPGEIIEAIELPAPVARQGWGFHEVAATHGGFALAGAAAIVALSAGGEIASARLALMGVGPVPLVPDWLGTLAGGRMPSPELEQELRARLQATLEPTADAQTSADYRRAAASELAVRAVRDAAVRAGGGHPHDAARNGVVR